MSPFNKTWLFKFLMAVSMIIWGGSWVSAKAIADTLPSETLTFWRFFITSISFIPILFFMKAPLKMDKSAFIYTLLGSFFIGLYLYLFFIGLTYGFAGAAGVLVTTMIPLATFVLSAILFRHRISAKDLIGLLLGVIGGSILLNIWNIDLDKLFMSGNIYFLICALLWASLTLCSQKAGDSISPLIFNFFTSVFGALLFFFFALPHGIFAAFSQGAIFWLNMFYLAVISSGLATTVYFFASNRLGSHKASSFVFLVPSSALIFSWMFLGEQPKLSTIAGGLIAIIAVYLINIK